LIGEGFFLFVLFALGDVPAEGYGILSAFVFDEIYFGFQRNDSTVAGEVAVFKCEDFSLL